MAENDGARENEVWMPFISRLSFLRELLLYRPLTADSASLPVVHIGSADTCLRDLNTHIPRVLERGNWSIFEGDILDSLEDEGGV